MSTARCCANCKYWDRKYLLPDSVIGPAAICSRVRLFHDITEWSDDAELVLKPEHKGVRAYTTDASDYRADLITAPNFYCIEFKAK